MKTGVTFGFHRENLYRQDLKRDYLLTGIVPPQHLMMGRGTRGGGGVGWYFQGSLRSEWPSSQVFSDIRNRSCLWGKVEGGEEGLLGWVGPLR